jgi:hypothetical protein
MAYARRDCRNDRFGSTADSGGYPQFRPLSGAEQKSIFGSCKSVPSQEQKFARVSEFKVLRSFVITPGQYPQFVHG